jgi:Uncharacterized protein conserved in bacteria (DUF2255)
MSAWTPEELDTIGTARQIGLASRRPNGTLRRYVTIWAVTDGEDVYVRSAYGYDNPWFQRADPVTAAYHAKYDRYGPRIVGTVVSPEAVRSTLRVVPR